MTPRHPIIYGRLLRGLYQAQAYATCTALYPPRPRDFSSSNTNRINHHMNTLTHALVMYDTISINCLNEMSLHSCFQIWYCPFIVFLSLVETQKRRNLYYVPFFF